MIDKPDLCLGHLKKHGASDFPRLAVDRSVTGPALVIDRAAFLRSWGKFFSVLDRTVAAGGKVLFVCVDPRFRERMAALRAANRSSFFYMAHRWIPGFLTNSSVVRYNVERYFLDPSSYATRSRLRTCRKLYEGLQNLLSHPDLLVLLGSNKLNVAAKEAMSEGVPVIAIRDTDARLARRLDASLFMNDESGHAMALLWAAIAKRFAARPGDGVGG